MDNADFLGALVLLLSALVLLLSGIVIYLYRDLRRFRKRYAPLLDIGQELARLQAECERVGREQEGLAHAQRRRCTILTQDYAQAKETYDALKKEISLLEENLEDISFGFYKPHFNFQTSEVYKQQLEALRVKERSLIRGGSAAVCSTQWTVGGSKRDGERMARQNTKLVLRAFHGECDAVLAKVAWNNVTKMEERLRKSFDAINQLGLVMQVSVTREYLQLKLDELRLAYEYEEKRHEEQEEQRRIREQMREEERAQQALEKARIEAEREEMRFQKALEKARVEAARVTGEQLQQMEEQIEGLEMRLAAAHRQKERAISMAQLTKSGYVYVISNVGSFGENVYKVGMTRRLEPLDRVYELGDASVPFPFDVHAMIYSDNAPALESLLHGFLREKRLNMMNLRKEFFHVDLEDLEVFAQAKGLKIEFTKLAEAKEYRTTVAFRQEQEVKILPEPEQFPSDLFAKATP